MATLDDEDLTALVERVRYHAGDRDSTAYEVTQLVAEVRRLRALLPTEDERSVLRVTYSDAECNGANGHTTLRILARYLGRVLDATKDDR